MPHFECSSVACACERQLRSKPHHTPKQAADAGLNHPLHVLPPRVCSKLQLPTRKHRFPHPSFRLSRKRCRAAAQHHNVLQVGVTLLVPTKNVMVACGAQEQKLGVRGKKRAFCTRIAHPASRCLAAA